MENKDETKTLENKPAMLAVKTFLETTSVKGIPRIVKANSPYHRILWTVGFFVCTSIGVFMVYDLFDLYLSYPISTAISDSYKLPPFPDVTLCSLNQIALMPQTQEEFSLYSQKLNTLVQDVQNGEYTASQKEAMISYINMLDSQNGYFQSADLHKLHDSIDPKNFIFDCAWESYDALHDLQKCFDDVSVEFLGPDYGFCFIVQAKDRASRIENLTTFGLRLILYINEFVDVPIDAYDVNFSHPFVAGVRLASDEQNTMPDPYEGIDLSPGFYSSVRIHTTLRQRLQPPYGYCVDRGKDLQDRMLSSGSNKTYTKRFCDWTICPQTEFMRRCGCFSEKSGASEDLRQSYPYCGNISDGIETFVKHFNCNIGSGFLDHCDCPQICKEYMYDAEVSVSPWPHPNNQLAFFTRYIENTSVADKFSIYREINEVMKTNRSEAMQMLREEKLLRKNFLQVRIYFHGYTSIKLIDEPNLEIQAFIGSLGGMLNLWIGVTVLTLMEVFDLMLSLVLNKCQREKSTDKNNMSNVGQETAL